MPPRQAIAKVLKPLTDRGPESFIFPGSGKAGFLSENTLCKALRSLGFDGATAHGLRSLLTDQLYEAGFRQEAIERQKSHAWGALARERGYQLRFATFREYLAMFLWRPHG